MSAPTERTPLNKPPSPPLAYTYLPEVDDDGREVEVWKPGKSTFNQTLLNTLGDLIGTGLLATPIAIAHSGWVIGPLALAAVGAVTLWTLKILLRIIEKDRRLRNFTDVIGYALGAKGEKVVTVLFLIEVCAWVTALVVLFSDSLEAVWPIYTSNQWKVVGLVVVIPTTFLPLHYLSFSSALGIISTWMLVGILIFTGIVTPHSPGSIREPAHTDLWPSHGMTKLGTVFGLLISGFGGHGLIPNLIHDMKNPRRADFMVDIAYGIAMAVYVCVGVFGYLMYGTNVSDEVSKDLARTPGFSPILAKTAVWMVALNPLTKIALGIRPLADMIFTWLGLHKTVLIPQTAPTPRYVTRPSSPVDEDEDYEANRNSDEEDSYDGDTHYDAMASTISIYAEHKHERSEKVKAVLRPIIRVALAVAAVLGALVFPSFESLMSLLGSGFACITILIVPICAGAQVFGWHWYDYTAIAASVFFGVWGTYASFA